MATYAIAYLIKQPKFDYSSLYLFLESFPESCQVLSSHWLVISGLSARAIRDGICERIHGGDRVVVTVAAPEAAWAGLRPEVSDWLLGYLTH